MKIYQIISERQTTNEGLTWFPKTLKWLKGFTTAGKEEARLAAELEKVLEKWAPGIDKISEKFADMVIANREQFKKPPSPDQFLANNIPDWNAPHKFTDPQRKAIKQALLDATQAKIVEREAAKAAAKNPPPAPTTQKTTTPSASTTPAAQTTPTTTATKQKTASDDNAYGKFKLPNIPLTRRRILKQRLKPGFERLLGTMGIYYGLFELGDMALDTWADKTYYEEELNAGNITQEQYETYRRQLIEIWIAKAAIIIGAGVVGSKIATLPGGLLGFLTRLISVGTLKGRIPVIATLNAGEIAGVLAGKWIANRDDVKEDIAALMWNYIDPGYVAVKDLIRIGDWVDALIAHIQEKTKSAGVAGNQPSQSTPAPQSGQTSPQPKPATTQPATTGSISGTADTSDEADDAYRRLMQLK